MSFNGQTDCPDGCLKDLTIVDINCPKKLDQAFFNGLNKRFDDLAQALCCVEGGIPEIPDFSIPVASYITEKFDAGEIPVVAGADMTVPLTTMKINTDAAFFSKNGNSIKVLQGGIYQCVGGASTRGHAVGTGSQTYDVYIDIDGVFPYFAQPGTNMRTNDDIDAANAVGVFQINANQSVSVHFKTERSGGTLYGSLSIVKVG